MSNSLQPHKLQHARLPCSSLSPEVYSNSCPLSQRCHPTTSSSVALFSCCPQSFPASGVFSNETTFHIRWLKYWIFSTSTSNEYCGLISFMINWFDLHAIQGTLNSLLQHQKLKASIHHHSTFSMVQLICTSLLEKL